MGGHETAGIHLRKTKNGETRVVPMTPDVFDTFTELHQERRLDTQRVFLYNGKPSEEFPNRIRSGMS